jgi:hypothetical protein
LFKYNLYLQVTSIGGFMKCKLLFSVLAVLAISSFFACDNNSTNAPPCTPPCDPGGTIDPDPNDPNKTGTYATLASNKNLDRIREMYNIWIGLFYVEYENDNLKGSNPRPEAAGTARIKAAYNGNNTGTHTCSEAIGYGMLLTSLMGEFDKLDKLFAYSKLFPYINNAAGGTTSLMRWNVTGFTSAVEGFAPDADVDILTALIIAYKKTGQQRYLDEAIKIGKSLYELAKSPSGLLLPAWTSDGLFAQGDRSHFYNISYMSLVAIKSLADYDKDGGRDWNGILNATLDYMKRVQDAGDGLWPDWSDENGNPINPCNNSNTCLGANGATTQPTTQGRCSRLNNECPSGTLNSYESYFKETPRIPWRIAWYYHWYGDNRAKAMLDRGMEFIKGKGITESNFVTSGVGIREYYSYKGNRQGDRSNINIVSSLCALGMGNSANQSWIDGCNRNLISDRDYSAITSGSTPLLNYYGGSLWLIYAMLFNGKF